MDGRHPIHCHNCGVELLTDKEKEMEICLECRSYGLLYGCWPKQHPEDSYVPADQVDLNNIGEQSS